MKTMNGKISEIEFQVQENLLVAGISSDVTVRAPNL